MRFHPLLIYQPIPEQIQRVSPRKFAFYSETFSPVFYTFVLTTHYSNAVLRMEGINTIAVRIYKECVYICLSRENQIRSILPNIQQKNVIL